MNRVKVKFKRSFNGTDVYQTKEVSAEIANLQLAKPDKDRNPAWRGAVFAENTPEPTAPETGTVTPEPTAPETGTVRRRQRQVENTTDKAGELEALNEKE